MTGIASPAWAIAADSHGATLVRMAQQGLLGGTGMVGEGGKVEHVAGKLEVKINPFQIYIPGTLGLSTGLANAGSQHATYSNLPANFTTQGTYATYLAEAQNLAVSTPSPSHERLDLVVAQIEDAEWSGSLNQAVLSIITGTPEASPKAPEPPANCVVLAQYKVPVGATEILEANITQEAPQVAPGVAAVLGAYSVLAAPAAGTEYGPSATRPTLVVLQVLRASSTISSVAAYVGATKVGEAIMAGGGAENRGSCITFICPAKVKWHYTSEGTGGGAAQAAYLTL